MEAVALGLVGCGVIGRRHAEIAADLGGCRLAAIADPDPAVAAFATRLGADHVPDLPTMLAGHRLDGVILATPTPAHADGAQAVIAAGLPVLIEKPIADGLDAARRITAAADAARVPVLVGHHRRHSPIVAATRDLLRAGEIGRLLAVNLLWAVRKPDSYYAVDWRTKPGAGPVLTNMIHEIDLLRFVCGEIVAVTAETGRRARGLAVEDTAVALLRFADGAVATLLATDAAPSPWSWDGATGENTGLAMARENYLRFLGDQGSLEFPDLHLWRYPPDIDEPGWQRPLARHGRIVRPDDPYRRQLCHFLAVIRGEERPVSDGADATRSLAATLAIHHAALSCGTVTLA
jgi:predicted dehydrogenase